MHRLIHLPLTAAILLALGSCREDGSADAPRSAESAQAETASRDAKGPNGSVNPQESGEAGGEHGGAEERAAQEAALPSAKAAAAGEQPVGAASAAPPPASPTSGAGGFRERRLGASRGEAFDHLGGSIGISGEAVVAGARFADGVGVDSGAAYVFRRGPDGWHEEARLAPADALEHDRLGNAVAIDGDVIVAGAHAHPELGRKVGTACVFRRAGGRWNHEARLAVEGSTRFGQAVAVRGQRIAVGAPGAPVGDLPAGAVYVFRREAGSWRREAALTASDAEAGDLFGLAVAMSAETVVVGAPSDDERGSMTGAVYVFRRDGAGWRQEDKLLADDAAALAEFGKVVALDGDTLVVGAEGATEPGATRPPRGNRTRFAGAAYVFRRREDGWLQEARLLARDRKPGDRFGNAVAVHGDAVVVGAHFADPAGLGSGTAYLFRRRDGRWQEETKLAPSGAAAGEEFGKAVGVWDGVVVVGALRGGGASTATGSVFVFEASPPAP